MSRISIKTNYTDGEVLYGAELNANNRVIQAGVNDNFEKITNLSDTKANANDVNSALENKVNLMDFTQSINNININKADKSELSTKANISDLDVKADKTYVDNAVLNKTDKSYVDNQLSYKVNKDDVETSLNEKFDKAKAGDLSKLNTTYKDDLVGAINEMNRTSLPIASTDTLGAVKVDGTTITADIDGTIHAIGGGSGGGTSDYNSLSNRPSINEKILEGAMTADDLDLVDLSTFNTKLSAKSDKNNTYTKQETDSAISDATSDKVTSDYVSNALANKADKSTTYTKQETDSAIKTLSDNTENELDLKANKNDVYTKTETTNAIDTAVADKITENEFNTELAKKQDKLTAGENITIENNVISSSGGGTSIPVSNIAPINPSPNDLWIDSGDTIYLAEIDSEVSTTSTNAIQNKAITEYVNGTILYNNSSGTQGNIALNDDISNYAYIKIYFKNNDGYTSSAEFDTITALNNGKINLFNTTQSSSSLYYKCSSYIVTSNTISVNENGYSSIQFNSSGMTYNNTNDLFIQKIIGYKEV